MKNDEINFNFHNLQIEESKRKDKAFLCRKHFMTKDFDFDEFEDGLNVSGIDNNEENQKITKNSNNNYNNISIDEDFSQDLDLDNLNENESQSIERKLSFESIQINFDKNNHCNNNENDKDNYKKKITKEDLNNMPLPIFDCIYCTNDKIVFNNFINNILSDKYLLLTSKYDINNINKLILNQPFIDKFENSEKLLNIIIKNTEYIKDFIPKERYINYFKSSAFNNLCQRFNHENKKNIKKLIDIIQKRNEINFKGKNKISKISNNNKCLFNSSNSLINNFNDLNEFAEPLPHNIGNNNPKNYFTMGSGFNNSININSLSLNQNEYPTHYNTKANNNILEYSFEKIENKDESANDIEDKDEIMDIFKYDLVRKISKNDIKWDNKIYDIYNPEISSDYEEDYEQDKNFEPIKKKNINLINDNYINNSNIFNNSIEFDRYIIKDNTNINSVYNNNQENKYKNNYFKNINNSNINNDKPYNNINNITLFEDINVNNSQGQYNIININNSLNQKLTNSSLQDFSSLEINQNYKIYKNTSFIQRNGINNYHNKQSKYRKKILDFRTPQKNNSITNNNSTNYSNDNSIHIHYQRNNKTKSNSFINAKNKYENYCSFQNKNKYYNYKREKNKNLIKSHKMYNYLNNLYLSYLKKKKSNHYKYYNKNKKNMKYKFNKKKNNNSLKFYLFDLKHKKRSNNNLNNNNKNYKKNNNKYCSNKNNIKPSNNYFIKNNNNNLYNKSFKIDYISNTNNNNINYNNTNFNQNNKKFYNGNHAQNNLNKAYYFFNHNHRLKKIFNGLYLNNTYYKGFYNYNNITEYNSQKYCYNK